MLKYKSLNIQVKDITLGEREVAFYFANFNNIDSDGDVTREGAFSKTLNESFDRIKHLYNHRDSAGKLQRIEQDSKGAFAVSKLGRHTLGNDVLFMYEDGLITEHSFGYETIKSNPAIVDGKNCQELTELKLWEVSSLDKWGANSMTNVIGVNGKSIEDWANTLSNLTKALKNGKFSDETCKDFELKIKQIESFLISLNTKQPDLSTEEVIKPKQIDYNQLTNLLKN